MLGHGPLVRHDGRQRRIRESGGGDVVHADDGEVVRRGEAEPPEAGEDGERRLVALAAADAPAAVTTGVLVYTIALVASGWTAGKISDRTGRRKILVAGSALLFAIGTGLLVHVSSLSGFYLVEALLGLAYGIYAAVDLALVVDVLPNPDDSGKDLGVFNIASALPQTAAPVVGAALLAVGSLYNQNYTLMLYTAGALALIGALVVLPIKGVR